MQVKFNIRRMDVTVEKVKTFIKTVVPRGAVKIVLAAIVEYLLGNEQHGLRHYEPYKYVSRIKAYGKSFFTEKQRRWFWANGGPDMIGNNRTNETANAWQFKETNSGYGMTIWNPSRGARWIWHDKQARQPAMVGHRTAREKIKTNLAGALRHAKAKVGAFIRSKK